MISRIAVLLLLLPVTYPACSQQQADQRWYKGNLHTHSFWSDGDEYPEMIMDWYKRNGYNFVALSDHNILAEGEKWIRVPKSRMFEDAFLKYLGKYGKDWVNFKTDSGRTTVKLKTYQEYKRLFEDDHFLIIQAEEISDRFEGKPVHINATNINSLILPQGGSSVVEVMQRNIDAIWKQRAETGKYILPHINHPNFYFAVSAEDMIRLRDERFFEVYNGHPLVHNYGDSLHDSAEAMWDKINVAYLNNDQPPMYGLATDDSHNYHSFGLAYSNAGRGWIMVKAEELTASSLIEAMEAGQFYASTGVTIEDISFAGDDLKVRVKREKNVRYRIEFIGAMKDRNDVKVFKTSSGTSASYRMTGDHLFVRIRIISNKVKPNPFRAGDYEMAWTQPFLPGN